MSLKKDNSNKSPTCSLARQKHKKTYVLFRKKTTVRRRPNIIVSELISYGVIKYVILCIYRY